jgi:hypothetical protein
MDLAIGVDCAARSHQRLRHQLTAEDPPLRREWRGSNETPSAGARHSQVPDEKFDGVLYRRR